MPFNKIQTASHSSWRRNWSSCWKSTLRQTSHVRPAPPTITTPTRSHLAQCTNWPDLVRVGLPSKARAAGRCTSLYKPCQQLAVGTWLQTRRSSGEGVSTAPLAGWRSLSSTVAATVMSSEMRMRTAYVCIKHWLGRGGYLRDHTVLMAVINAPG